MKRYVELFGDVFEVTMVNGREVLVNKTAPLRREIKVYKNLVKILESRKC